MTMKLNSPIAKWVIHITLWSISVYVITSYFAISNDLSLIDLLYSLVFHMPLFLLVYLNLELLIPRLWRKSKYSLYVGSTLLLIGFTLVFHNLLFDVIGPLILEDYLFVSFTGISSLIRVLVIYLVASLLFSLSSSWFDLQKLQKEKIQLELDALKSQLNPHFLFNGINSIYSLSIQRDPRASETLLKLSDLLRYSLYELKKDSIPLEREVEMIENYLEIQKTRLKNPSLVSANFDIKAIQDKSLPPMLLLPIVENIFKHGDLQKKSNIQIIGKDAKLFFRSSNRISKSSVDEDKMSGIGMANIKKRLELLYPKRHLLAIYCDDDRYTLELTLDLS